MKFLFKHPKHLVLSRLGICVKIYFQIAQIQLTNKAAPSIGTSANQQTWQRRRFEIRSNVQR